jgi:hypothetical protein
MTNATEPETSAPPKVEKARKIYPTVIAAASFVLFCAQPMLGFVAILLAIPVAIWMIFQLVYAIGHPGSGKNRALRVGVWLLAYALVFGIHAIQENAIRQRADAIVAKIETYQARHKTCPPTLEAIGESRESLSAALGRRSLYACVENAPYLVYTAPASGFDMYLYDFERKTWDYRPD